MQTLQDLIHKFEVGDGRQYIQIGAGILLFITVLTMYNLREASGFASQEAMDQSQLARNIADGHGYTTQFIRPLSMRLIQERHETVEDPMKLEENHPDLANAPVYPYLMAAFMKVLPFDYEIPALRSKNFYRYQPEVLIGYVNQAFFILSAILLYFLGLRLFDQSVAWFSAVVFLGTDLLWRFAFSGLSTTLAMFLLLLLVHLLVSLEQAVPELTVDQKEPDSKRSTLYFLGMAFAVGLVIGGLALTRYSFGWLIIPTVLYCAFYLRGQRVATTLVILATSLLVIAPWLARNYQLSGNLFGTAGYALWHDSSRYVDNNLERTLGGEMGSVNLRDNVSKVLLNTGAIAENNIPKLGGSWLTALFLAGLLVPFANRRLNHLRVFALLSLLTLTLTQALGATYLTRMSPDINSENLIVLVLPLIFLFGAGFFYILLDQLDLSFFGAQFYLSLVVILLACLPLIFRLLPPRQSPVVYPPYSPPLIQRVGNWFDQDELIMSDMPWAMAWYGDKKSIWLTRNLEPDFYTINDRHKPINGLYLTPITTDGRFLSQMIRSSSWAWGRLHMDIALRKNLPRDFPLLHVDDGFLPDQLILTDWPRWGQIEK